MQPKTKQMITMTIKLRDEFSKGLNEAEKLYRRQRLNTINNINIHAHRNELIIGKTLLPTGPQPRDFDSWRNYIRNTLLTMQVINNDGMYSFSKYPVNQVASREEIRHKVSDGTGCYSFYRALELCKSEPTKRSFIQRILNYFA